MGKSAQVTSNRFFLGKVLLRKFNHVWGARGILCHREKAMIIGVYKFVYNQACKAHYVDGGGGCPLLMAWQIVCSDLLLVTCVFTWWCGTLQGLQFLSTWVSSCFLIPLSTINKLVLCVNPIPSNFESKEERKDKQL